MKDNLLACVQIKDIRLLHSKIRNLKKKVLVPSIPLSLSFGTSLIITYTIQRNNIDFYMVILLTDI